jgi:LemA protein
MMGGIIFWGGLLLIVVFIVSIFNKLVTLKHRFENAFSQIDVQLKRRYDLIPNLVETAKAYMAHERDTLEAVIAARNNALAGLNAAKNNPDESTLSSLGKAETALQNAMGHFQMVMEAYPDLKANTNMMQLTEELVSTENKISFSRQAYNDSVTEYNIFKHTFPAVVLASTFGHVKDAALLDFDDKESIKVAPKISF